MPGSPAQELERHITEAETLHTRLILIVGPPRAGKSILLRDVHQRRKFQLLNVNLHLSERLLDVSIQQRPFKLADLLKDAVGAAPVVLLDNLEVLFDPDLKQDPLRLLEILARKRTVVAVWPGDVDGSDLSYAEPGHREYRRYTRAGAILVHMKRPD